MKSARRLFIAALALFLSWVAALAIMALVSGTRPISRASRTAIEPTPPLDSSPAND